MSVYPWRRFRSRHASCMAGSEKSINYTSHHLRCEQLEASAKQSVCQHQKSRQLGSARSWPGTAPQTYGGNISPVFSNRPDFRTTAYHISSPTSSRHSEESSRTESIESAESTIRLLRPPPLCRLPITMRFTTLLLYITLTILLLSSPTAASPLHNSLHRRQAIPDKFGETGNEPAPVKSQPPPVPFTPTITLQSVPSSTTTPEPTTSPSNTNSNTNTNTSPQNELGSRPSFPPEALTLVSTNISLSPGAIAGIAGAGVAILLIFAAIFTCLYRRHRRLDINEIPIRRSRLGSRLAHRFLGDSPSRGPSRSASRRGSDESDHAKEKEVEAGWVDKGTISRPKNAWLENGFLSVPRPGFVREEVERGKGGGDERAPWVIGEPRPLRPVSAEPLGRLSGMGMGMGYLK